MTWSVLECWLWLLLYDLVVTITGVRGLYWALRMQAVRSIAESDRGTIDSAVHAIDLACVFYFKEVKCLQRSTVATLRLRRRGWNAQMVFAAQMIPLKNHAWCEIDGQVVNDKPYIREMYQVLERR